MTSVGPGSLRKRWCSSAMRRSETRTTSISASLVSMPDFLRDSFKHSRIASSAKHWRPTSSTSTPRCRSRTVIVGEFILGSAGCQPARLGSLPRRIVRRTMRATRLPPQGIAGKLPAIAGWQPALPRNMLSREYSSSRQRPGFRLEIPGDQPCAFVEREVSPGPLDQNGDAIAETDKKNDVDKKPGQPGRQSAEMNNVKIGHGPVPSDRRHAAFVPVTKTLRLPLVHHRANIAC